MYRQQTMLPKVERAGNEIQTYWITKNIVFSHHHIIDQIISQNNRRKTSRLGMREGVKEGRHNRMVSLRPSSEAI